MIFVLLIKKKQREHFVTIILKLYTEFEFIFENWFSETISEFVSSLPELWKTKKNQYPIVANKAIRTLIPIASSYLCETSFFTLAVIKIKYRSRLNANGNENCTLKIIITIRSSYAPKTSPAVQPPSRN